MGKFTKDVTVTLLSRIANFAASIITLIIIARILGPEGKGIYTLTLLFPILIVTFSTLGVDIATVYFIGQKKYSLKVIIPNNLVLTFGVSTVGILVGSIIILLFRDSLFPNIPPIYLLWALLLIPLGLFSYNFNNILRGLQKIVQYNLIPLVQGIALLILVVISFSFLKKDVLTVIMSAIAANFIAMVLLFKWIKKLNGKPLFRRPDYSYIKDSIIFGSKGYLGDILGFLMYRLDMFLINIFSNPAAVGFYSVAVGLVEKLLYIPDALSTVLFPRISSTSKEKERKEFTPTICRVATLLIIVGIILVIMLGKLVICVFFSQKFLPAVTPLRILAFGMIPLTISRILGSDLSGRGKPIFNTYSAFPSVIINLILNWFWIPKLGINGAAWASTIAYTVNAMLVFHFYSNVSKNSFIETLVPHKSDIQLLKRVALSFIAKKRGYGEKDEIE